MAKKRFEGLNTAEQLTQMVEKVAALVPPECGTAATDELRRVSGAAVALLLEQSELEFQKSIKSVKTLSKAKLDAAVAQ